VREEKTRRCPGRNKRGNEPALDLNGWAGAIRNVQKIERRRGGPLAVQNRGGERMITASSLLNKIIGRREEKGLL